MQKIIRGTLYIPLIFLIVIYATKAVGGLMQDEEYIGLVQVFGFGTGLTTALVYLIFILDGAVALLLIFGNKLASKFPWGALFLWVAFWPWVPRFLQYLGGTEVEASEALVFSLVALLAYYLNTKKGVAFFRR